MAAAGIQPAEDIATSRKLVFASNLPNVEIMVLRGSDVLTYVRHGAADVGVAGKDMLLEDGGDGLYELFGRFEVERYLEYNAYNFPKTFDPLSYLYICKTMNIFDAGRNKDKLEDSFAKLKCNLHLIAFEDDMLFFPEEMEEIRDIMIKLGKQDQVTYKLINSKSGHDSFLVEVDKFADYTRNILEGKK